MRAIALLSLSWEPAWFLFTRSYKLAKEIFVISFLLTNVTLLSINWCYWVTLMCLLKAHGYERGILHPFLPWIWKEHSHRNQPLVFLDFSWVDRVILLVLYLSLSCPWGVIDLSPSCPRNVLELSKSCPTVVLKLSCSIPRVVLELLKLSHSCQKCVLRLFYSCPMYV